MVFSIILHATGLNGLLCADCLADLVAGLMGGFVPQLFFMIIFDTM